EPAELVHVLTEDLAESVADVVVERLARIRQLAFTTAAKRRSEQRAAGAGAGSKRPANDVRRPPVGARAVARRPPVHVPCEGVESAIGAVEHDSPVAGAPSG